MSYVQKWPDKIFKPRCHKSVRQVATLCIAFSSARASIFLMSCCIHCISLEWMIGALFLFLQWLWMMMAPIICMRFIRGITKNSTNLWDSLKGSAGREKFLGVAFRFHLEVSGIYCTGPRMTRGIITLTGFDWIAFASLCVQFAPVFDSCTPCVPSGTSCFQREMSI